MVALAGCGSATGAAGQPQGAAPSTASLAPTAAPASPARGSLDIKAPAGTPLPLQDETADAKQVITVVAPSLKSTSATLQAWDRAGAGWVRRGPAVRAYLGDQGMTARPSESLSATPAGSFTLTQAFGRAGNPGTRLPYFRTDSSDWWVTDTSSTYYNAHYRCRTSCPFRTTMGENLYRAGFLYTYAVVIDYNRRPVTRGAGSAFFLHVTEFKPTTGCVSVPQSDLVSILRWLSPSAHPRIILGVA
jgi:L,D-peptidoglycan transpeptidase YkuD (ErfK/YbiS/YcfS/YnhG family)